MGQPAFKLPEAYINITTYRKFLKSLKELKIDLLIIS